MRMFILVRRLSEYPASYQSIVFLADPYSMFWINKEDTNVWPWELPHEKRTNVLSETERISVMEAIDNYYKRKKEPILFITKEFEDFGVELANRIQKKELSKFRARILLKKEFPNYPPSIYKDMIEFALSGHRFW